tara:strand:- start:262 stop:369 length:108 start_codon:yes stop_codon:yes gene_type:complete
MFISVACEYDTKDNEHTTTAIEVNSFFIIDGIFSP